MANKVSILGTEEVVSTFQSSPVFQEFWKCLERGKFSPLSEDKIIAIVDQNFFSGNRLTPLKKQEQNDLRLYFSRYIAALCNEEKLRALCEDGIVLVDEKSEGKMSDDERRKLRDFQILSFGRPTLVDLDTIDDPEIKEICERCANKKMQFDDYLQLFSDPEKVRYLEVCLKQNEIEDLEGGGYAHRHLRDYACAGGAWRAQSIKRYNSLFKRIYPDAFSEKVRNPIRGKQERTAALQQLREWEREEYVHIFNRLRKGTGKQHLTMLDVGGGIGQALSEAKEIDSTIHTINLTPHDSLIKYPIDELYLSGAETMPSSWEENVDFIVSNRCIEYCLYPDLALRNIIKALSVGGEAYIDFGVGVQDKPECFWSFAFRKKLNERMQKLCEWIKSLQDSKVISIETRSERILDPAFWASRDNSMHTDGAFLDIRKHSSTNSVKQTLNATASKARSVLEK